MLRGKRGAIMTGGVCRFPTRSVPAESAAPTRDLRASPRLHPPPPSPSPPGLPTHLTSSIPAGMTHVSPYSASAKGFTYPDHSLESPRPKALPQWPPPFEPLTAPPDEEKGRKFRSPSSTSSLGLSPVREVGRVGVRSGDDGDGGDGDLDGIQADLWLGLGRGGAAGMKGVSLFEAPVMAEAVQSRSMFSPESEWARRINQMVLDPSQTSLEIR